MPGGTGEEVSVFAPANTDIVIDFNSYFARSGQAGLSLYPTPSCRVLDTSPPDGSGPFSGTLNPPLGVGGYCLVPLLSQASTFSATVVPQGPLGYLTMWPDRLNQPVVSTLNAPDGTIAANMAIVPAGNQGKVEAYAGNGTTNLILDLCRVRP